MPDSSTSQLHEKTRILHIKLYVLYKKYCRILGLFRAKMFLSLDFLRDEACLSTHILRARVCLTGIRTMTTNLRLITGDYISLESLYANGSIDFIRLNTDKLIDLARLTAIPVLVQSRPESALNKRLARDFNTANAVKGKLVIDTRTGNSMIHAGDSHIRLAPIVRNESPILPLKSSYPVNRVMIMYPHKDDTRHVRRTTIRGNQLDDRFFTWFLDSDKHYDFMVLKIGMTTFNHTLLIDNLYIIYEARFGTFRPVMTYNMDTRQFTRYI